MYFYVQNHGSCSKVHVTLDLLQISLSFTLDLLQITAIFTLDLLQSNS